MEEFQQEVTDEDDPYDDHHREKLKHSLFKEKHPDYKNIVVEGASMLWH